MLHRSHLALASSPHYFVGRAPHRALEHGIRKLSVVNKQEAVQLFVVR